MKINFTGINSPNFQVNINDGVVTYKSKEVNILFFDKNHPAKLGKGANYNRNSNLITISGCTIDWNKEENKWNNFDFEKDSLYHELIHYFDYQNIENDNYEKVKINNHKNIDKEIYSKYLNHGTEFNAHFMQYVMPTIKDISNYKRRYNIESFGQFKKEVIGIGRVREFYELLNPRMKKHFMKRLAEYYQKIFKTN